MTAFQFDSKDALEQAKQDFCTEHDRNPKLNWDDLDEIFSIADDNFGDWQPSPEDY